MLALRAQSQASCLDLGPGLVVRQSTLGVPLAQIGP